jgi:hypothetical protein
MRVARMLGRNELQFRQGDAARCLNSGGAATTILLVGTEIAGAWQSYGYARRRR